MSSILDALERASKERAAKLGQKLSSDSLGRESAIEKQLRNENQQQRRIVVGLAVGFAVVFVVSLGVMAAIYFGRTKETAPEVASAKPAKPAAAEAPVPLKQMIASLEAPTPTSMPSPTAAPEPTPAPSPEAAVVPTPAEETYIQNVPDAALKSYKGIFTDGQIIRPAEVGLVVGGVMELKGGNIAIINDKQVREGQKIGEIQITEIRSGLITADIGDGTIVKIRF